MERLAPFNCGEASPHHKKSEICLSGAVLWRLYQNTQLFISLLFDAIDLTRKDARNLGGSQACPPRVLGGFAASSGGLIVRLVVGW